MLASKSGTPKGLTMFKKTCKYCGKTFETKRYPSVFCSQSCYFKYKRAAANEKRLEQIIAYDKSLGAFLKDGYIYFRKKCVYCGNSFISTKSTGKYCCIRCHDADGASRRRKNRKPIESSALKGVSLKIVKTCEMCRKRFVARKAITKFCSSECARKFRRKYYKSPDPSNKVPENPISSKELMRIAEAAEYLSVSRTTLYRALWNGLFEVTEVQGVYLIRKASIDEYVEKNASIILKRADESVSLEPEATYANPIVANPNEYITLTEALQLYGESVPSIQFLLRHSGLQYERFRNVRFYKKSDVESFVKKRIKSSHPEILEWYTVEEIMNIFGLERKSVYNLTFVNKIPKKKEHRTTYYSKKHIDKIFLMRIGLDENFYPAQVASEKSGLELRRLYKVVKRLGIPTRSFGGRLWISKKPFDELVKSNSL